MTPSGLQQIPVTDWVEDSEERFPTGFGELNNREWLQMERRRIGMSTPLSRPVIRMHPGYFDKDSHGRRRNKLIALFRFIDPAELKEEREIKTQEKRILLNAELSATPPSPRSPAEATRSCACDDAT